MVTPGAIRTRDPNFGDLRQFLEIHTVTALSSREDDEEWSSCASLLDVGGMIAGAGTGATRGTRTRIAAPLDVI